MRERAAVGSMAAGAIALIVGAVLLAGVAVGVLVLGAVLVGVSILLGWDR